ncbi:MAG TPA: succinate dehydrogenase/fumarate reductase iron-sulfur subunit [Saprospiraceae bacterium]|nr:succinate dehydrogenase/fumarate reductase iron-sulfur subunit [Saprospiraceae bacterium]
MKLNLKIWRQKNNNAKGHFETHVVEANEHMSFLEMLDVLNQNLLEDGKEPVAYEHDCREGICGACSMVIDGHPHGPNERTTTCQLHMRFYKDGQTITVEPFRAKAFPIIKDLAVDRSSFDRIIQSGGFISVNTGGPRDANDILIDKDTVELAMDAAACIGCGACVAACPNGAAMLFTAAKVSHLNLLPQGKLEKDKRALGMVRQMDKEGFGNCTNLGACEAECPKGISLINIAMMNKNYLSASILSDKD